MKVVHAMSQRTKLSIREAALAACAVVAFILVGCGGSSSSAPANTGSATTTTPADGATTTPVSSSDGTTATNTPASTRSVAEGMWQGKIENSSFERWIFLDDGTLWLTYGDITPNGNVVGTDSGHFVTTSDPNLTYGINGVGRGSVSVTGNSVTASGTQIDFFDPELSISGSRTGTVTAQNTLTLISATGNPTSYSYDATYDQPVALASLAGSYISTNIGSGYPFSTEENYAPGTLTITSGGTLTLNSDTAGCAASGTIAQHNTPHGPVGVFDISLTFSGATCPLGDGTTGIGIAYLTDSGAFLEAIGYTASSTSAFAFRAHRAQ
jgi:hypothetical protein